MDLPRGLSGLGLRRTDALQGDCPENRGMTTRAIPQPATYTANRIALVVIPHSLDSPDDVPHAWAGRSMATRFYDVVAGVKIATVPARD